MSGFIGVAIVLVLAVLFGWLSTRTWRVRNTAVRIVGGGLTALLTLLFAVVSIVGLLGVYRLHAGGLTALLTLLFAVVSIVGLLGVYRLHAPHGQPAVRSKTGRTARSCAPFAKGSTVTAGRC